MKTLYNNLAIPRKQVFNRKGFHTRETQKINIEKGPPPQKCQYLNLDGKRTYSLKHSLS
jgi:hypothetical protein